MNCQEKTPVTATLVPLDDRMDFLPDAFGFNLMVVGENTVYGWMERLSIDYMGGYWHFYKLSNGGFYMAPNVISRLNVEVTGNYYTGEVSPDAAGIIATLFALGQMASQFEDDRLINACHALREFAITHPEWNEIGRAID
jgi:hypothetical protein